jgi:hypothetical protein
MRVLNTKQIVNKYTEPNIKRPVVTVEAGERGFTTKPPKEVKKGTTNIMETYPSNDLTGVSKEQRWLGTIRLDKNGVRKKIETFYGDISVTNGAYRQTVDYGKYKKVIDINKQGEGKISLFNKKGNEVYVQKIKSNNEIPNLIEKSKSARVKIDNQINNAGVTTIQANGKKVIMKDGYRILSDSEPSLTATKINFDASSDFTTSISKSNKYAQVKADTYFTSDIVQSNARSGQAFFAEGSSKLNIQKKVGQKIEVGENKEIDTVLSMKGKNRKATILNISPKITREITEGSSSRIIQFISPKGKLTQGGINLEVKQQANNIDNVLKEQAKPLVKKIKELKSNEVKLDKLEPSRPLIVGGEGGVEGKSLFQFNPQLDNVPTNVYVQETSNYLKGAKTTNVNLPEGFNVVESTLPTSSLDILGKARPKGKLTQPTINIETDNAQSVNIKPQFVLDTKTNDTLNIPSKENTIVNNTSRSDSGSKLKEEVTQQTALTFKEELKQYQQQKQKQREVLKTKGYETFKPKSPKFYPKLSLLAKLSKAVDTTPDLFKVYARKKGKDILIGKETSLEGAKTKLTSSLSKTLRASGFITKGTEKIKVSKLGNLGANFGTSKKDEFRLIEKKNKRIKKGTQEQSEINVFRKRKIKGSIF